MTEQEWLACTDRWPMLNFMGDKASHRKVRLLAVACCRRIWHLLANQRSRRAVEVAESHADSLASDEQLIGSYEDSEGPIYDDPDPSLDFPQQMAFVHATVAAHDSAGNSPYAAAVDTMQSTEKAVFYADDHTGADEDEEAAWNGVARTAERAAQISSMRDILGPLPFRSVPIDLAWLTFTVTALAQSIYADRAFERLPILADALEDAGCNQQDILSHCRGPGPHTRGCWVVDLLLAKE